MIKLFYYCWLKGRAPAYRQSGVAWLLKNCSVLIPQLSSAECYQTQALGVEYNVQVHVGLCLTAFLTSLEILDGLKIFANKRPAVICFLSLIWPLLGSHISGQNSGLVVECCILRLVQELLDRPMNPASVKVIKIIRSHSDIANDYLGFQRIFAEVDHFPINFIREVC